MRQIENSNGNKISDVEGSPEVFDLGDVRAETLGIRYLVLVDAQTGKFWGCYVGNHNESLV